MFLLLKKENVRDVIEKDKAVYVYGGLTKAEANDIFGEQLFPVLTVDEYKSELEEKGLNKDEILKHIEEYKKEQSRKFDVVGAYKYEGKLVPYTATIQSDTPKELLHYIDAILDNANADFLPRNKLLGNNKVSAEPVSVDSSTNHNASSYIGGKKVANINMDYYLEQEIPEYDSTYDHFGIKDHMEFRTYNGADPWLMRVYHGIPYTSDEMKDWDPPSTTNRSSFQVSLPWGIGWSFNTNDDIDVDTRGSQTNDYVEWNVDEARTWSSYLHNPERFTPGSAWLSTGTYARTSITNQVWFDYKGQTHDILFDYVYSYDY